HLCHGFIPFAPPKIPYVNDERYEYYKDVVNATYRFHDLLLSRLLKLAGEDTTVMLVSDHGYQTGHRRPKLTPNEPAGPVIWHRPFGVMAMRGPGIKEDELVFGSSIADVTPTILAMLGLPIGQDMIGRPWQQAFSEPLEIETVSSWEDISGDAGMHPPDLIVDTFAEQAALDQLVELGYMEKLSEDKQERVNVAVNEYHYNLGRALLAMGDAHGAIEHLEPLHRKNPKRLMVALHLADCYQRALRLDDCRNLLDYIASGECYEQGLENRNARVLPQLDFLYGLLELNSGNLDAARERLLKAEQQLGHTRGLHTNLGNIYHRLEKWDDAERAYTKALETDPDDHAALAGMAVIHLRAGRHDLSISCALQSLSVLYYQPQVHYLLAVALAHVGQRDRARQALEVTLKINPGFVQARELLSKLSALS
ncbi:MAG TPA: tetratricopeptide repeat protein, partial [Pirellulaceae bacterium]|nr:tetratricopeptide repeat protein [Pirellulaceae bacterium]